MAPRSLRKTLPACQTGKRLREDKLIPQRSRGKQNKTKNEMKQKIKRTKLQLKVFQSALKRWWWWGSQCVKFSQTEGKKVRTFLISGWEFQLYRKTESKSPYVCSTLCSICSQILSDCNSGWKIFKRLGIKLLAQQTLYPLLLELHHKYVFSFYIMWKADFTFRERWDHFQNHPGLLLLLHTYFLYRDLQIFQIKTTVFSCHSLPYIIAYLQELNILVTP